MKKIVLVLLVFLSKNAISQSVPIGSDDMLRVLQLSGKIDAAQSFTARPFFDSQLIDSLTNLQLHRISYKNNQFQVAVLPVSIATKFNSHHPFGWNDAGMIMAKGLQTMLSAGIYAKAGPLHIQLKPEWYYAVNPNYDVTPAYGSPTNKSNTKGYLGQSSIRINLGPISIGASSENLWWGPGQFSSLMMSNNAPGFQHLTFNTIRPIKTPIGSFEWQLVAGKLAENTALAFENRYMMPFNPKNEWRYFNGIVLTYQPKWLPNFFLGLTRTEHLYNTDLTRKSGFVNKYLPVFVGSSPSANADASSVPSDGAFSFFTRWVLPKQKAEFYLEYGYNDFKQNLRDFTTNANHSSAYIVGFKKLINLNHHQLLDISGEITQMAQTTSYIVRNAGNWYEHGGVSQGFTYQNQIMGAGSGFGSNVQTLQVKKISVVNFWGIKLQRIQQDPKGGLYYGTLPLLGMREFQWTDLSLGLLAQKRFSRLLLNGEIQFVNSKNYGWEQGNKFNLFAQVKAAYFF